MNKAKGKTWCLKVKNVALLDGGSRERQQEFNWSRHAAHFTFVFFATATCAFVRWKRKRRFTFQRSGIYHTSTVCLFWYYFCLFFFPLHRQSPFQQQCISIARDENNRFSTVNVMQYSYNTIVTLLKKPSVVVVQVGHTLPSLGLGGFVHVSRSGKIETNLFIPHTHTARFQLTDNIKRKKERNSSWSGDVKTRDAMTWHSQFIQVWHYSTDYQHWDPEEERKAHTDLFPRKKKGPNPSDCHPIMGFWISSYCVSASHECTRPVGPLFLTRSSSRLCFGSIRTLFV